MAHQPAHSTCSGHSPAGRPGEGNAPETAPPRETTPIAAATPAAAGGSSSASSADDRSRAACARAPRAPPAAAPRAPPPAATCAARSNKRVRGHAVLRALKPQVGMKIFMYTVFYHNNKSRYNHSMKHSSRSSSSSASGDLYCGEYKRVCPTVHAHAIGRTWQPRHSSSLVLAGAHRHCACACQQPLVRPVRKQGAYQV